GLQYQLYPIGRVGRDDGEPAHLAHRDLRLLHEAEHIGVELQRLSLVVHHHAGEVDAQRHRRISFLWGIGHRSAMLRSGPASRSWNTYRPALQPEQVAHLGEEAVVPPLEAAEAKGGGLR